MHGCIFKNYVHSGTLTADFTHKYPYAVILIPSNSMIAGGSPNGEKRQ